MILCNIFKKIENFQCFFFIFFIFFFLNAFANAKEFNAISSLPAGCNECVASPSPPAPSISEYDISSQCSANSAGVTNPDHDPTKHTYTLSAQPCFNSTGEWIASLTTVNTRFGITRSCPGNPSTILCLGDVAGLTKAQACAQLANYPSPFTINAMNNTATNYWCRECNERHEEAHMNIDWIQDALQDEINTFVTYLLDNGVVVDCSTAITLNCSTAITATVKSKYDTQWQIRITAALNDWDAQPEGLNGDTAEMTCYEEIIDALRTKCNAP